MFYMQRLQEQYSSQLPSPYGCLAVRAYFNHDSLCVEVLHAKDVVPLDPNGFSDPFVIIELLPRRIFSHCTQQQTNVHKVRLWYRLGYISKNRSIKFLTVIGRRFNREI